MSEINCKIRVLLDELTDFRVQAGERAEGWIVVRIAQESGVEDHVRLAWQTSGISKGYEGDGHARRTGPETLLDERAQARQRQVGCVDEQPGALGEGLGEFALQRDAVRDRARLRERMA